MESALESAFYPHVLLERLKSESSFPRPGVVPRQQVRANYNPGVTKSGCESQGSIERRPHRTKNDEPTGLSAIPPDLVDCWSPRISTAQKRSLAWIR
jgi:hypothetical protein